MRYCFEHDDDGHDYLIPVEFKEEFNILICEINKFEHPTKLSDEDFELYEEKLDTFCQKFDQYRIGTSYTLYSFEKPEKIA